MLYSFLRLEFEIWCHFRNKRNIYEIQIKLNLRNEKFYHTRFFYLLLFVYKSIIFVYNHRLHELFKRD